MNLTIRHFSYLILAVLCIVLPYLVTLFFIVLFQDRIEGVKFSVSLGVLIPQIIYGLLFLKFTNFKKVIYSILIASIILGINYILIQNDFFIKTNWDLYGYWDMVVLNFLTGFFIWIIVDIISKRTIKHQ